MVFQAETAYPLRVHKYNRVFSEQRASVKGIAQPSKGGLIGGLFHRTPNRQKEEEKGLLKLLANKQDFLNNSLLHLLVRIPRLKMRTIKDED